MDGYFAFWDVGWLELKYSFLCMFGIFKKNLDWGFIIENFQTGSWVN
jgi:hypothetical protein